MLTKKYVTSIPETEKDIMNEVIDMMFFGQTKKYGDTHNENGEQNKRTAKQTAKWDTYEKDGHWGSDVQFVCWADGKAFHISGTRTYYEPSDELLDDEWGWTDSYNWTIKFTECDLDWFKKELMKRMEEGELTYCMEYVDGIYLPQELTNTKNNVEWGV